MLGFPSENNYSGTGVYSHLVALKEPLDPPVEPGPRLWQDGRGGFPEECIVRPRYGVGREIMVYNDMDYFHSAPDVVYRDSVWRFM